MAKERKEVMIEGAELRFLNFSGNPTKFNMTGKKEFAVELTEDLAVQLEKDGWNVKRSAPNDEGEEIYAPLLHVQARFDIRPPKITMLTNNMRTRTYLNEESVEILDAIDIANVDVIINGSFYDVNGKTGIKAYLRNMFVTVEEDALDRKYAMSYPDDDETDG